MRQPNQEETIKQVLSTIEHPSSSRLDCYYEKKKITYHFIIICILNIHTDK